jgi:CCR4-NOT transcription complex subunit 3
MSPVNTFSNVAQHAAPPLPVFPLAKDKTVVNGSPKSTASPSVAIALPDSAPHAQDRDSSNEISSPQQEPAVTAQPSMGDPTLAEPQTAFGVNGTNTADIAMLPPGLRDLLHSFQSARSRAEASSISSAPLSTTGKMLEASKLTAPDAFDSESKPKYVPQTPYETPEYYPQLPHSVVTDPAFVRRCDVDTLFFMFYYQQETIQQYVFL